MDGLGMGVFFVFLCLVLFLFSGCGRAGGFGWIVQYSGKV